MTSKHPTGITLTQLETLCGHWPGVTGDIKWGDNLVFSVGGKMFVMARTDGREGGPLAFKVADQRFLELTDQPGVVPAPYLARARWVSVTEPRRFATAELEMLLLDAYVTVRAKLPKKAQAALAAVPTARAAR